MGVLSIPPKAPRPGPPAAGTRSGRAPAALAGLALVAGALLDLFGPEPYVGLPLLAAAPLVAAATLSFRAGAVFAGLAAAVSIALDIVQVRPWLAGLVDLAVVGVVGALALAVNTLLRRQGQDLARATYVAEAAQRAVLPQPPARAGPLAVASAYTAAQAEARIGGDLFAVQETPFGVRLMIGDVRGKGMQAVSAVSVAVGAFRQEADRAATLGELADQLDRALSRNAVRSEAQPAGEEFMTALLAEVSADGGTLRLVNRGHPPPYLLHAGAMTALDPSVPRFPLGLRLAAPDDPGPAVDTWRMPPGATLLLVTDGVTEARDAGGVFYDPRASALAGRRFDEPHSLVDALTTDVNAWTGNRHHDDMAVLAVTRTASASGPDRR